MSRNGHFQLGAGQRLVGPTPELNSNGDPISYEVQLRGPSKYLEDDHLAHLQWGHTPHVPDFHARVASLEVQPELRGQGIATFLWDHVRQTHEPALKHSPAQTAAGKAWAAKVDARRT